MSLFLNRILQLRQSSVSLRTLQQYFIRIGLLQSTECSRQGSWVTSRRRKLALGFPSQTSPPSAPTISAIAYSVRFNYAAERGFAPQNVMRRTVRMKQVEEEIEILTVDECDAFIFT